MYKLHKKRIFSLLLALALFGALFSAGAVMTGNGALVWTVDPDDAFSDIGVSYAKVICLKHNGGSNGTLIATADQQTWVGGEQVWPIYRSTNGGSTWSFVTNITDTTLGTKRKCQPTLYELPQAVGNLAAGTLLLAGNFEPMDQSTTNLVVYKSTNCGSSWTYMSTIDTGGPAVYDPSPSSTTSAVWEPSFCIDDYGHLVCYYSDERQKADDVLQACCLKYTSNGTSWSALVNVTAIDNQNDRPGMITVSPLPNGTYIATYEVVNKPSLNQNSSVVYYKFSDDGITWDEDDLGTQVFTADGISIGSSPFVKWVDAGGPNGMIIIGSKWQVASNGDIMDGGQNFFVNYNLGQGYWERLPQPVTWYGVDVTYMSGYSQGFDTNANDTMLYHASNVTTGASDWCEIRVGTLPLTAAIYEAENAALTDVTVRDNDDASGGQEVGYINYGTSVINFNDVVVPSGGTYTVYVRYNNGTGSTSSHLVSVNGGGTFSVSYPATADWNRYQFASFSASLNAGSNTIALSYNGTYAEVDCIEVYKSGTDLARDFMIVNRNSDKLLEVPYMSTTLGQDLDQWGWTGYNCQLWTVEETATNGYYTFTNVNSDMVCEIEGASTSDGALAQQYTLNGNYCQHWALAPTDSGYFNLVNRNSSKFLEVQYNSTADGAAIDQWGDTGYPCQEWTFAKEGMR